MWDTLCSADIFKLVYLPATAAIIINVIDSWHRPFPPGASPLEPTLIPTAQASFHIVCDVPSIAVFCSESIEYFPGRLPNFSLTLLLHF